MWALLPQGYLPFIVQQSWVLLSSLPFTNSPTTKIRTARNVNRAKVDKHYIFLYEHVMLACMCVSPAVCAEARRGLWIPCNWLRTLISHPLPSSALHILFSFVLNLVTVSNCQVQFVMFLYFWVCGHPPKLMCQEMSYTLEKLASLFLFIPLSGFIFKFSFETMFHQSPG